MECYSAIKYYELLIHDAYMEESQNSYAEWKKPDKNRVHTIRLHLYKILVNVNL